MIERPARNEISPFAAGIVSSEAVTGLPVVCATSSVAGVTLYWPYTMLPVAAVTNREGG